MEYISLHGYIRNTPSDRTAHRTSPDGRQEYLTTGKESALVVQGTLVQSLVQEDPTCRGPTQPV